MVESQIWEMQNRPCGRFAQAVDRRRFRHVMQKMLACREQLASDAGLRELREEVRTLKNESRQQAVQFQEPGDETKPDEDCKMEVDDEADSRK